MSPKRFADGLIGGLLMSGRRPNRDSGEPDLWSNRSVFQEPSEPISIDPSPHIPLQQTTVIRNPVDRFSIETPRACSDGFPIARE